MTTLREALRLAREALTYRGDLRMRQAITAIDAALAQPAASGEPVAPVTASDAMEALDNLDDYARMPCSVDPIGARTTLERFIAQQPAPAPVSGEPVAWAFQHADGRVTYHSALEYPIAYRDTCIDKWPLYAAPQPAPALVPLTHKLIREARQDAAEVFDAEGPETPQVVRDVIEYMTSWMQVYADKAGTPAKEAP